MQGPGKEKIAGRHAKFLSSLQMAENKMITSIAEIHLASL
jgi:hypothetical protein